MIHAKQYSSAGPNFIIIHGLFGNADNWHSIAQNLSEFFNVYCIDLPNHGLSDSMTDATYPKMAQAVLDWANENSIGSFYLMGHSMGGKVAMQMASMTTDNQIEKLIVADMSPVDYQPSHLKILEGLQAINEASITSRKEADALLSQYEPVLGIRQFLLKNLVRNDQGHYVLSLSVSNINASYSTILRKPEINHCVEVPTLFIKGELSDYITQDYAETIMSLFPQASFKMIPGTGHWLHAEKPVPFSSLVKRFLL